MANLNLLDYQIFIRDGIHLRPCFVIPRSYHQHIFTDVLRLSVTHSLLKLKCMRIKIGYSFVNQSFLCGSIIACLCSILLIHILYPKLCERIKLQIVLTCIEVDFMHMIATNLYKPILDLSDPDFRC